MQLTNLLAIFALAGFASAECFNTGVGWEDLGQAAIIAQSACSLGMASIEYGPGEEISVCAHTLTGKVDMHVRHLDRRSTRYLHYNDCYEYLRSEIYGCGRGGLKNRGPLQFKYVSVFPPLSSLTGLLMSACFPFALIRSDPNSGRCG